MESLDEHGHDTDLARRLRAEGLVDTAVLQKALADTRRARPQNGWTLARSLIQRGVLSEDLIRERLAELQAPPPPPPERPLRSSLGSSGSHPALGPDRPLGSSFGSSGSHSALVPQSVLDGGTIAGSLVPSPDSAPWSTGTRIGEFRLLGTIAKGGMGIVYLAENVKTSVRYAVKALAEKADPDFVERLRREGEAQASVDAHPNVVRVHALGRAFGRLYLVMDLVTGGTLQERVRKGPLSANDAARLVRELARGLEFMHEKGVIHRDLKPSNVMFDEHGTPKLADFGLALVEGASRLTRSGELMGTPAFMAPEQALGRRDQIGPWTDVYGLGGILYYALAGRAPFDGANTLEILSQVMRAPVVPLRLRHPGIAPSLEAICLGALAKEPADRPSPAAFARSLEAYLEERTAPKTRPVSRGTKRLVVVALATAVGTAAIAALAPRRGAKPTPPPVERTAPVAPVVTREAARPSLAPAKVEPPSLVWTWPGPRRAALAVSLTGDARGGMSYAAFRKLVFTWTPEAVSPTKVTLVSRIDAFEVRWKIETDRPVPTMGPLAEWFKPVAFDSEKPDDASSPFHEVVGRSFDFDMDPRTGAVVAVRNAPEILQAILAAVKDDRQRQRFAIAIPELAANENMAGLLDAVLHLVGEDGGVAGGHWTVLRPEVTFTQQQRGRRDERTPIEVSALIESQEEHGGASFKWKGERTVDRRARKIEGTASFEAGHVVRSEQNEEQSMPEGSARGTVRLEEIP